MYLHASLRPVVHIVLSGLVAAVASSAFPQTATEAPAPTTTQPASASPTTTAISTGSSTVGLLGVALGLALGISLLLVGRAGTRRLRNRLSDLEQQNAQLRDDREESEALVAGLRARAQSADAEVDRLRSRVKQLEQELLSSPNGPARTSLAAPQARPTAIDSLENAQWLGLVEECVSLFADLEHHASGLDDSGREIADHVCSQLMELMRRCGVDVIDSDASFQRSRHQPRTKGTQAADGQAISSIVRPGFAVGRRVLRRATVELRR